VETSFNNYYSYHTLGVNRPLMFLCFWWL